MHSEIKWTVFGHKKHLRNSLKGQNFSFFLNPAGLDLMNYRLLAEMKIAIGQKIWGAMSIRNTKLIINFVYFKNETSKTEGIPPKDHLPLHVNFHHKIIYNFKKDSLILPVTNINKRE